MHLGVFVMCTYNVLEFGCISVWVGGAELRGEKVKSSWNGKIILRKVSIKKPPH